MADGLVSQAQGGEAPAAAAPELQAGEEAATPEEQEAYDSAMQMASEMLHASDEASAQILQMMSGENPIDGIVSVVEFIIGKIEETFQGNLPEATIIPLSDEISDWVIELGEEAGLFDLSEDQIFETKGAIVNSLTEQYGGVAQEDMQGLMKGTSEEAVQHYISKMGGA